MKRYRLVFTEKGGCYEESDKLYQNLWHTYFFYKGSDDAEGFNVRGFRLCI